MNVDLVDIIRDNPGCIAVIDNDSWYIVKDCPNWDALSDDERMQWHETSMLVSSSDNIVRRGSGYGSGNVYGGDVLQALAEIVGIKIESV